jgi:hypothetical protein
LIDAGKGGKLSQAVTSLAKTAPNASLNLTLWAGSTCASRLMMFITSDTAFRA